MKTVMNKSKLASLVLIAAVSSTSQANEIDTTDAAQSNDSTYWGLGIGSILGGIIAGPPGIAIGASLGGAFGWGQDQNEALELTQAQLIEKEALAEAKDTALNRQSKQLNAAKTHIGELKRSQHNQAEVMDELRAEIYQLNQVLAQSELDSVLKAYTQDVYFDKGQSKVPVHAEERLAQLAEFLKLYPNVSVTLTGYTDQSGSVSFNQKLSHARAESVRELLTMQGIDSGRMSIQSQGEALAKASEGDQGGAVLDRRVAIEFSQPVAEEAITDHSTSNEVNDLEHAQKIEDTTLAELSQ